MRTLVLTWDVPRVVLAGGVADLGEPLAEAVRRRLADEALDADLLQALHLPARVSVLPASRCATSGALGAARSAAHRHRSAAPPCFASPPAPASRLSVEVLVLPDAAAVARTAADVVQALLARRPTAVLGLATGSSVLGLYEELADRVAAGSALAARGARVPARRVRRPAAPATRSPTGR